MNTYDFDDGSAARIAPMIALQAAAEAAWLAGEHAVGSRAGFEGFGSPDDRNRRIREAAYLRAACRGFTPGLELEDWLAAEREVDMASFQTPRL